MSGILLASLLLSSPTIEGLQGGSFGAAAIDLKTGELLFQTGEGTYPLSSSEFLRMSFAAEVAREAEVSLQSLFAGTSTPTEIMLEFLLDPASAWHSH